ncbi:MAG: hypothetical protein M1826_002091 [Phylliscum demangeonii]|nr:MAG: hypothetical protein M1826_002091 [Phylliscum demangeonii]
MCEGRLKVFTCGHLQLDWVTRRCSAYQPDDNHCPAGLQAAPRTKNVYHDKPCRECSLQQFDREAAARVAEIKRGIEAASRAQNDDLFEELLTRLMRVEADDKAARRQITRRHQR